MSFSKQGSKIYAALQKSQNNTELKPKSHNDESTTMSKTRTKNTDDVYDLNDNEAQQWLALCKTARLGDLPTVEFLYKLLVALANVCCRPGDPWIGESNIARVKKFLDITDGIVDINGHDKSGWTALTRAASNGDKAMFEFLITSGARLDVATKHGRLPIDWANEFATVSNRDPVNQKEKNAAEELLKYIKSIAPQPEATINERDEKGWTPLCVAAAAGDLHRVQQLIESGASFNIPTTSGDLPIHCAARLLVPSNKDITQRQAALDILRYLKSKGASLSAKNGENLSALDVSFIQYLLNKIIDTRDIEKVREYLIETKDVVDINAWDIIGYTPLCAAARNRDVAMIKFLVESGARTNVRNKHGKLPIQCVQMPPNLMASEQLIKDSVCTTLRLFIKMNPGEYSFDTELTRLLQLETTVATQVSSPEARYLASEKFLAIIKAKNVEEAKLVFTLSHDVLDINYEDKNGFTPLDCAISNADLAMVEFLVNYGANVNRPFVFKHISTHVELPIEQAAQIAYHACLTGNTEKMHASLAIIRLLRSKGSSLIILQFSPNLPVAEDCLPPYRKHVLKDAIEALNLSTITDYLDMGISCNTIYDGTTYRTLLNYLISRTALRDISILKLLLQHGADATIRDEFGNTPLENLRLNISIERETRELAELLLSDSAQLRCGRY